jgi:penicillin-binding protein 1A
MKRVLRWLRILAWLGLLGLVLGVSAVIGVYSYFNRSLPEDLTQIHYYRPLRTTEVYAAGGELIGEFFLERREVVPLSRIPDHMLQAIVAAEDQRFFTHPGIDPIGTVRAFVANLSGSGLKQGASGLTQQLARGFFLSPERNYTRKIKEAILSFRIENELTKEQILELYLNHVYLGHGAYGVAAASRAYFGKNIEDISLGEAAILAGLPQAPTRYSPYVSYKSARTRQSYVLGRMVALGFITPRQAEEAIRAPLFIVAKTDTNAQQAPYFVAEVRERLIAQLGWDRVYGGGLKVYTTVDLRAQEAAQEAVRAGLVAVDRRRGWRGPLARLGELGVKAERERLSASLAHERLGVTAAGSYRGVVTWLSDKEPALTIAVGSLSFSLDAEDLRWAMKSRLSSDGESFQPASKVSQAFAIGDVLPVKIKSLPGTETPGVVVLDEEPLVQGALVALEPSTGEVKALVGGYDYEKSEFNRATQGLRQPGSSFKPIIYAAALDAGYTPESIVHDAPISFPLADGQTWTPQNFGDRYYGDIKLRDALAKSLNTVAVRLALEVGIPRVVEYARRFGVTTPLPNDVSVALGSGEVTVLEMAAAYAVFPRMGRRVEPVFIRRIEDDQGAVIWSQPAPAPPPRVDPFAPARADPEQAISPATAYLMIDMMKGVIDHGTATKAKLLGRPAAGKTGTTNASRNVWFNGYTPDLVCTVWVGYDDNRPLGKETGGSGAVPIWMAFMQAAEEDLPVRDFATPAGIQFQKSEAGYVPVRAVQGVAQARPGAL